MLKNTVIPSAITSLRFITLPFLLIFLYKGDITLSFALFVFCLFTDFADGYAARRFHAASRKGAYYDSFADFCIIISVFFVFSMEGLCPYWVLVLLIFSFVLFMVTSVRKLHMYDPIGKYFGGFLYAIIALLMIEPTLNEVVNQIIVLFFVVSLVSRIVYLCYLHRLTDTKKGQV